MISESLERSRRFFWAGKFLIALGAILLPIVAYLVTFFLVDGRAKEGYFEAVSQILPVLLLALAVEQRYFSGRQTIPEPPPQLEFGAAEMKDLARLYGRAAQIYALMVLAILGLGEWIAVEVLATGESSGTDLQNTAGSLAAGFTALIVSALVGTRQTSE